MGSPRRSRFATWLASDGEPGKRASAFADDLWDVCQLARLPHELLPGLDHVDAFTALRLAMEVARASKRWRRHQVEELLRSMDGDKDAMGVGRVIALLAMAEVGR